MMQSSGKPRFNEVVLVHGFAPNSLLEPIVANKVKEHLTRMGIPCKIALTYDTFTIKGRTIPWHQVPDHFSKRLKGAYTLAEKLAKKGTLIVPLIEGSEYDSITARAISSAKSSDPDAPIASANDSGNMLSEYLPAYRRPLPAPKTGLKKRFAKAGGVKIVYMLKKLVGKGVLDSPVHVSGYGRLLSPKTKLPMFLDDIDTAETITDLTKTKAEFGKGGLDSFAKNIANRIARVAKDGFSPAKQVKAHMLNLIEEQRNSGIAPVQSKGISEQELVTLFKQHFPKEASYVLSGRRR